jgi:4a-hydroxytetrahydrobiopterin dehydratase
LAQLDRPSHQPLDQQVHKRKTMSLLVSEIASRLAALPAWEVESGELVRTVACKGFPNALAFVNRVGLLAEAAGHHPDIDIRYDRVRLALVTHSAGGLTAKDFDLAAEIDKAV